MNVNVYREKRVRVTKDILKCLISLMGQEGDTGVKKIHPAKWYRFEVAENLSLPENKNPSLRSYEVAINNLRNALKKINPLDKEWHLGTLFKHPLHPETVAKIIDYKIKASAFGMGNLSIRTALWMDRLSALPISNYFLQIFAFSFSAQERNYELMGDEYAFSRESDEEFIKVLREKPEYLKEEHYELVPDHRLMEIGKIISEYVTPEKIKEISEKVKKHKRTVNK